MNAWPGPLSGWTRSPASANARRSIPAQTNCDPCGFRPPPILARMASGRPMLRRDVVAALGATVLLASCSDDSGPPEEFYRGKTIQVLIGMSAGGAYDVYARMLARHMGKHIPGNPRLVPSNMEGAG